MTDTEDKGTKHKHKAKTKAGAGYTPRAYGSALHIGPTRYAYACPIDTKQQAKTNKDKTKALPLAPRPRLSRVSLIQATEKQTSKTQ